MLKDMEYLKPLKTFLPIYLDLKFYFIIFILIILFFLFLIFIIKKNKLPTNIINLNYYLDKLTKIEFDNQEKTLLKLNRLLIEFLGFQFNYDFTKSTAKEILSYLEKKIENSLIFNQLKEILDVFNILKYTDKELSISTFFSIKEKLFSLINAYKIKTKK